MGCYNDITATATASALNLAPVVGRVRIIRHLPKSVYVVRTSEDRLSRRVGERGGTSERARAGICWSIERGREKEKGKRRLAETATAAKREGGAGGERGNVR